MRRRRGQRLEFAEGTSPREPPCHCVYKADAGWMAHETYVRCALFGSTNSSDSTSALALDRGRVWDFPVFFKPIRRCTSQHSEVSVQPNRTQRNTEKLLWCQSGARKSNNGAAIAYVPTRSYSGPPPPLSWSTGLRIVCPYRPLRSRHLASSVTHSINVPCVHSK
jgi:hypothetical protein